MKMHKSADKNTWKCRQKCTFLQCILNSAQHTIGFEYIVLYYKESGVYRSNIEKERI